MLLHVFGIAVIIALVFSGLLYILLKSFFDQKGKNLATKTDIQEITRLAEEIKGEIDVRKQGKIGFDTFRRDSIINYYKTSLGWLMYCMLARFDDEDYETQKKKLNDYQRDCIEAENLMRLFVEKYESIEHDIVSIRRAPSILTLNYLLTLKEYNSLTHQSISGKSQLSTKYTQLKDVEYDRVLPTLIGLASKCRSLIKQDL